MPIACLHFDVSTIVETWKRPAEFDTRRLSSIGTSRTRTTNTNTALSACPTPISAFTLQLSSLILKPPAYRAYFNPCDLTRKSRKIRASSPCFLYARQLKSPTIMSKSSRNSLCIVIAGPNGAGKTTFAREFLPKDAGVVHFVNSDLIAGGLSPLRPELAALAAGRLVLKELDRLAKARLDFAFESTLSGLGYLGRLKRWKANGYRIEIVYLRLSSPRLALRRIAARVKQGGHNVPRADALRRFSRSWINFQNAYRLLADEWTVYDNSGVKPRLLERKR